MWPKTHSSSWRLPWLTALTSGTLIRPSLTGTERCLRYRFRYLMGRVKILYISQKLTPAEQKYAAMQREARWVVEELRYRTRWYFTLKTVHAPLHLTPYPGATLSGDQKWERQWPFPMACPADLNCPIISSELRGWYWWHTYGTGAPHWGTEMVLNEQRTQRMKVLVLWTSTRWLPNYWEKYRGYKKAVAHQESEY